MKGFRYLIILVFVLSFFSCKPQYIREGVKQIDSLTLSLDTIRMQLEFLDSAEIKTKYNLYLENIAKIKAYPDTDYSEEEWTVMTQYGQIRKPLRNYIRKMPDFFAELAASTMQLDNLKYDLKGKFITEEQFHQYYQKEKEALKFFEESFRIHYNSASVHFLRYDTLNPLMNTIIENIESNSNKDQK